MQDLFHVHTFRCQHAEDVPDRAYIDCAIRYGMHRITFTDHAPFPKDPFQNRMRYGELPEYLATLQSLKAEYAGRIDIRIGLEVEYLPSYAGYYEELAAHPDLDLLILGQHFYELCPGVYSFSLKERSEEHYGCKKALMQGIQTGLFSAVAHPDRSFRRRRTWDGSCDSLSRELISLAMTHGVALEQNLSSMKRRWNYWPQFWDLVPDTATVIVGADAHRVAEAVAACKAIRGPGFVVTV